MSNETLSLPVSGTIGLSSFPDGTAPGDVFQWNGTQWTIVPNDNNNPLLLTGIVPPPAPSIDSGVLYKQTGSDGLWWRTDLAPPVDVTLGSLVTTDVPAGLNVFTVNSYIPAVGNNYYTIQAAVDAAGSAYDLANATDSGTAQAGAATTITLALTASAVNSTYNTFSVEILSGTGAGQRRYITAYVGATRVATVQTAWVTNPDATSVYRIVDTTNPKPVIHITPGTYVENVNFNRQVIVEGFGDPTTTNNDGYCVILDGQQTMNSACIFKNIQFDNSTPANSRIILGTNWDSNNTSVSFTKCIITNSGSLVLPEAAIRYDVDYTAISNKIFVLYDSAIRGSNNGSAVNVTFGNRCSFVRCTGNQGTITINSTSTNSLFMQSSSHTGRINVIASLAVVGESVLLANNYRFTQPTNANGSILTISGNNHIARVTGNHFRMNSGANPVINISGSNCILQEGNNTFDTGSSYGQKTITVSNPSSVYQSSSSPAVSNDLNVYTVNSSAPIVGNNYATIQDAFNAIPVVGVNDPFPVILLSIGSHDVAAQINVNKRVMFVGQDNSEAVYQRSSVRVNRTIVGNASTFLINSRCSFRNIEFIDSNRTTLELGTTAWGSSTTTIENCRFSNSSNNDVTYPTINWRDTTSDNRQLDIISSRIGGSITNFSIYSGTCRVRLESCTPSQGVFHSRSTVSSAFIIYNTDITGRIIMENAHVPLVTPTTILNMNNSYVNDDSGAPSTNPAITCTNVNAILSLRETNLRTGTGAPSVIGGAADLIVQTSNVTLLNYPDGSAGNNIIAATVVDTRLSSAGDDLNVFTVNPSRPLAGRNYHTIQAAIDASVSSAVDEPSQVILITPGTYTEDLTINKRVIIESFGDGGITRAVAQSVTIDGTTTVQDAAIVRNIRFIKTLADGLPIIQLGAWVGLSDPYTFSLISCRVISTSARARLVDWRTTTGAITCRLNCISTLLNVFSSATEIMYEGYGENRLNMVRCAGTSGSIITTITSGAASVLTMQDCSHIGFITIAGNRASLLQTVILQGCYRFTAPNNTQPWFRCTGNKHQISMENINIRMPTGGSNAIEFTGTGCQLDRAGMSFDRTATYGQMTVSSVSALTTRDNDAVDIAQALNVFTVNSSAPIIGKNYATIQAAIDAAEIAIDAIATTGTAQAGAAASITLAASSVPVTTYYVGWTITITAGTGAGQSRAITAYNGGTLVATVAAWVTVPDATSVYSIVGTNFVDRKTIIVTPGVYAENLTISRHLDIVNVSTANYVALSSDYQFSVKIRGSVTIGSGSYFKGITFDRGSALNCIVAAVPNAQDIAVPGNRRCLFTDCAIVTNSLVNYAVDLTAVGGSLRMTFQNTEFCSSSLSNENHLALSIAGAHQVIVTAALSSIGQILINQSSVTALQMIETSWSGNIIVTNSVAIAPSHHVILKGVNMGCSVGSPFTIDALCRLRIEDNIFCRGTFAGVVIASSAGAELVWVPGFVVLGEGKVNALNTTGTLTQLLLSQPAFVP